MNIGYILLGFLLFFLITTLIGTGILKLK